MKTLLAALVLMLVATAATAKDKPIWKSAEVFNQSGQFCLDNKGVFNIRPNMQGNYWLTCSDGTMVRIKIKRVKSAVLVAKL